MLVGLIGAGSMARALARRTRPCPSRWRVRTREELARELGGEALDSNVEVADRAELHKPAQFSDVARELRGHAKAVASVCGSIDTAALRQAYQVPVFRFMPNTPVEVRRGVLCYSPERRGRSARR